MIKSLKITALMLVSCVLILVSLAGYYVYTLSFNERVICAVGEPAFGPVSPLCRFYVSWISPYDSPEAREQTSSSLHWLLSVYAEYKDTADTAIAARALALAGRFLDEGADANFVLVEAGGYTLLGSAVLAGEPEWVRLLIKHGADPDKRTFIQSMDAELSARELAAKLVRKHSSRDVDWPGILALLEAN